jgi:hypothetical protein
VSLRPRLLASTSFLISSLCAGALAQTAPSPDSDAPAAAAPVSPAPGTPNAAAPTAQSGSTQLPAIEIAPPKPKPKPKQAKPAGTVTPAAPARQATAPGTPARPSPYATGGPNVAAGTPVVPQLASQMTISGEDLNARPIANSTEILEATPGLAVVQHSGSGKANQYYLRGYNLDHGTDMAVFWDDVPINLPTNAHGQGYADLNFLIPETISGLEVRKGPYFADIGDFANAGDLHLSLRDSVAKNIVSTTVGSFGYDRLLALGSSKLGDGSLLYAGEFNTYNGPWVTAEDVRKFSGLLRYSQGTPTDGFSATAMAYTNNWNSSDQVALRAITTGQIGLFGELDPTDGGDTSRFMLSTRFAQSDDAGLWKANAYLVKETMDLLSNFTWDTTDPINGDQFHQLDNRIYGGVGASRTVNGTLFNRPTETVFGVQSRYDDISVGLSDTTHRLFLSNILVDHVNEGNVGIYAQNTTRWTDWFRTTAGLRGDYFWASVNSILQPANSGDPKAAILSPKFTMTFGPFYKTELFLGGGMGYHSNDARGVTAVEVPGDSATPRAPRRFWFAPAGPRSAFVQRRYRISTARSVSSTCSRIRSCSSAETPAPLFPGRRAYALASRLRTSTAFLRGSTSMPILHCRARGLPASTWRKSKSSNRSPAFRRRRSATPPAISSLRLHGWWHRPASCWAKRLVGSARCAGVISARGRSPRTASSSRHQSTPSMATWAIGSAMVGASSSMHSIS